jgi:hypothetical protein
MSDEEKEPERITEPPKTDTKVVQPEQDETKEPPTPVVEPEPEPAPADDKDSIISELKAKLAKREEQITELRKPLVDELTQRGYQAKELNPLSMATLQKMVTQSRAATTEGLPGTVPAPGASTPKTLHEQRDAAHNKFMESLKKKQDERFKDW